MQLIKHWQRGDTIVEVMIVLAVLGSAVGLSYSTANRSLLNARQAQENSTAAKLAQTQVEALYANSAITTTADPGYIYRDVTFCMNGSSVVLGFSPTDTDQKNIGTYPAGCKNDIYSYSIRYSAADFDKFTVVVVWDDVLGQGKDTVTLTYRVHTPVHVP